MNAVQIEHTQLDGFITALKKDRHGRTHLREKHGGGKATFVTTNVIAKGYGLHGRISGPFENHATYTVELGRLNQVLININLEDAEGLYTLEKAYSDLQAALRKMMKRPSKKADFSGGRNITNLDGFYLKSTGKRKVGKRGKRTLAKALSENQISKYFHDHCIQEGFTMEYF